MSDKIYFENLPTREQEILNQLYGRQVQMISYTAGTHSRKISYLGELDENEKIFFTRSNFVSPNLFVQKLYKVSGKIIPMKFNLAVAKLIEHTEELRMNYCSVGERMLKVFFENRKEMPNIVYRNLENDPDVDATLRNIMEADMRQSFDLRYDNLIRFSVFHTAEEEYAILVTMLQMIANAFDIRNLFRSALGLEPLPELLPKTFVSPLVKDSEAVENYWAKTLQNLPPMPKLPFSKVATTLYKQKSYRMTIPPDIVSDLRAKSSSNKMMLVTILQSAWAILLQEFNHIPDVAFSTLMTDKAGENFYTFPIRAKADNDLSLQDLVQSQFKQFLISQPFASNSLKSIQKILAPQNRVFDHVLSFGDFLNEGSYFSDAKSSQNGQLVLQNSWSLYGMKLGIYFYCKEDVISISFIYDANKFSEDFGEKISRRYYLILQQMLTYWNMPYGKFLPRLSERFSSDDQSTEEDFSFLQNFLSQLKLLQSEDSGTLQRVMTISKLCTFFEGDRISGEELEKNMIIVAAGKLVRSIDTGDGWYNTLDIVKENRWINESVLLEKPIQRMSAEVLTEKAMLLFIPMDKMNNFLSEYPSIRFKILTHIIKELEKFQKLWVQA